MRDGSRRTIAWALVAFTAMPAMAESGPAKAGFTATPLIVEDREVVEPEADLAAFFIELSRMVASGEGRAELFAPSIRVFVRPADPLAAPVEKEPAKHFGELAGRMRAAGEPMPRAAAGRDPFLERLAADLGGDDPLGRIAGPVDAVCQPAERGVDRAAIGAALAAIGGDARGLRWSTEPIAFRLAAPGRSVVDLPAGTLLMREPAAPGAAAGRAPRFVLTDGRRGTVGREAAWGPSWRGLRTRHTCFGKIDGVWKVTAVILAGRD